MSLDVVRQVGSGQILDVSCGSKDCTAEGAVLKSGGVEVIEEHLFHLLLNLKSHEINAKSTRNPQRQTASICYIFVYSNRSRQAVVFLHRATALREALHDSKYGSGPFP